MLTPGQSYQLAATYDGATLRLYLDGQLEGSAAATGAVTYAGSVDVGASSVWNTRAVLTGRIGQLSLYAAALSAARVQAHYHASGLDGSASCPSGSTVGSTSSGTTGSASSSTVGSTSGGSVGSTGASASTSSSSGSTGTTGSYNPGFPRLGSALIATSDSSPNLGYDTTYVQWASKLNVDIMGANWVGAGSELLNGSREGVVSAIHSQSTVGSKVFQYYITDNNYEYWPLDETSVNSWLLYQDGTSGTCAANFYNTSWCNTNQTLFVPANANGLHLEGAFAAAVIATLEGSSADAAPDMDGVFHDNLELTPGTVGDYARDGVSEPLGDPDAGVWIRAGFAEGLDYLHAHSSLIPIGNISVWGAPPSTSGMSGMDASGVSGKVQGGFMEGTFGANWSLETWDSFAATQTHYQFCMANAAAPKLVLVHHTNLSATGADPYTATPYQAMRYSLAFTLMDDGYYATSNDPDYLNTELNWFDEYAVDPMTGVALGFPNVDPGLGYLGMPTDAAWPAALSNGTYERHFTNAATGKRWLVLLNPKGNGAQTVQLGQSMQKLTGTQAPSTNDGSMVTSVTLQDRDGLILMAP